MSSVSSGFGDLLRRLRHAAGLTQEELAELAHLSADAVSTLERGVRRAPRKETVALLAEALALGQEDRDAFEDASRPRADVTGGIGRLNAISPTGDADRDLMWSDMGADAARLALPTLHSLPTPPTSLLGRARDEVDVAGLLRHNVRLLTLVGPPGIGKTRLGLHVAASLCADFTDGVVFVPLEAIHTPDLVLSEIAKALRLRDHSGQSLLLALVRTLTEKRLLLVLDNFEQVLAAGPLLARLLGECPRLTLLVTSRTPLHLSGEQEFPVPALELPDRGSAPPAEELGRYAAMALFIQRAQAVNPDFRVTPAQAGAILAICRRLDGVPLAIELAAARIKMLPPQAILAGLERRLPLLTNGPQDLPERQRTWEHAVTWSYALLDARAQRLFRQLAVFANGWTLEAAAAVAEPPQRLGECFATLAALVDTSLVQVDQGDEATQDDRQLHAVPYAATAAVGHAPRYRLLQPLREDALERLEACGELADARRRQATYFLAMVEAVEPVLTSVAQSAWHAQLEADLDNLRAALDWAEEQGGREGAVTLGLRLAGALWRFWEQRGYLGEGSARLDRLLARDDGCSPPAVRAKALTGAGALAYWKGEYAQAHTYVEEGLRLYRSLGDQAGEALCLNILGVVAENQGEFAQATAYFEETLALTRALGDRQRAAWAALNLGCVWDHQGRYNRARVLYEEGLALMVACGVRRDIAAVQAHIAPSVAAQGDYARATQLLEESLAMLTEVGDTPRRALALGSLGMIAWQQGDYAHAAALCEEGLEEGLKLGHKHALAAAHQGLGVVALAKGAHAQAHRHFEEILTLFPENCMPKMRALVLVALADVARAEGDFVRARALCEESLSRSAEIGNDLGMAQALEGLALVALARDEHGEAVRLIGRGAALRKAAGTPLAPVERQTLEPALQRARMVLGIV